MAKSRIHMCIRAGGKLPESCGCRWFVSRTEFESKVEAGEVERLPHDRHHGVLIRKLDVYDGLTQKTLVEDFRATLRPRLAVSPPTKVMPRQADDGPVIYIRNDPTPIFSKKSQGCGKVREPEYLTCRECGKKVSFGLDMLKFARYGNDRLWRIDCPLCGDGSLILPIARPARKRRADIAA
jgi:hypothetical protein